jgi:hypothetical protein
MGVSVRLSRNARVYLPFWIAIPAYLIVGMVWIGIAAVIAVVWLIAALCKLAGRGIDARRRAPVRGAHRAAREAQHPEAIAATQTLAEGYQRQRQEDRQQREDAIDAELEEYRQQAQDHDARTHRYRVTECNIDALNGGDFTLGAEGLDSVHIRLTAKSVMHFLSLKAGDIVQVTFAPGNAGLEEFWQISRANGARPRSPVELSAADMAWLGLTGARSDSGGQPDPT